MNTTRHQAVGRGPIRHASGLSFAQRRLWMLDRIRPRTSAYTVARAVTITGPLDRGALARAVEEVVRRHEPLRTRFDLPPGVTAAAEAEPVQLVAEPGPVAVPLTDLGALPEADREAEALRLRAEEADGPFDLETGPLFRARVLRLGDDRHVLLLTAHAIVCDDASLDVVLRELCAVYPAFARGLPSPLQAPPVRFADYAARQRERLQGETLERLLGYWRRRLDGAPEVLDLPADRPASAAPGAATARASAAVSAETTEALATLARRHDATLSTALLASLYTLLFRYSGQADVIVGAVVPGPADADAAGLVGPLANALALRADLSGDPSFRELLGRVRDLEREADAHRDLPFERLLDELRTGPDLDRSPLSRVMFVPRAARTDALEADGLTLRSESVKRGRPDADLCFSVADVDSGLRLELEYRADLFGEASIRRMLANWAVLLGGIATDPERRVSRLPLLANAELDRILAWSASDSAPSADGSCVHELVERQAERTPEAAAVVWEGGRLTYAELDERANRLAHTLRGLGVGPDVLVGLAVRRSAEMVVGMLGVLKAGGAYVPLDPTYPRRRLAFLTDDARPRVLLTEERLKGEVPWRGAAVLCLDSDWERISRASAARPAREAGPDNLAYVIYTSGSTGTPKGVAVVHRGLATYVGWAADAYRVREGRGTPVVSPLGFDLTVTSVFPALVCGAEVVLVPEGDGEAVMRAAAGAGRDFSLAKLTPAHLEVLGGVLGDEDLAGWSRALVVGGEALYGESLARWRALAPDTRLVNEYGPTETVVGCSVYEVPAGACASGRVPIGRPIAGARLYLLDAAMEPVPIGAAGELYVGGDGVARGYLNRPDLTAERFVPDPLSGVPGARLYRTGDRARYLPDGDLEYLGRADHQVKIRGYRIELGEVESALLAHPGVREGAVITAEGAGGAPRLVACVVPDGPSRVAAAELREYLGKTLPEYMIPSAFTMLEALPTTPNGKVDRRALLAASRGRPEAGAGYVGPRDALERQIVAMWERLLGVEPVGVRDNFFEIGGDSLLAVRLFGQIANGCGVTLPLSTLFAAPTVERLARVLREEGGSASWSSLVAIRPGGSKPPLFCVHAGGANVLIYRPLARHLGADQPVYALQARGLDGVSPPHTRVEDMAAHYIEEIRAVDPDGPYYLLGASFGGLVAFEMALRLHESGRRVALLAMLNTACPVVFLSRRIRRHVGSVRRQGVTGYLAYAAARVAKKARGRVAPRAGRPTPAKGTAGAAAVGRAADDPLQRTMEAIWQASRTYAPAKKVFPGTITYFWAEGYRAPTPEADTRSDWQRLARGGVDLHVVAGNHTTMREEPYVADLADALAECLERARGGRVR